MDQELVQYLNEKFDGIDRRFGQIDQRFGQIDQRFGQIDRRFGQIDQRFGQIDQRFGQIDQSFEGVDGQIKGLRQEMHEGFDEVKRHSGILVEDLRYQVQLVAEGFATFVEGRYTQDQARIDERFRETHALIRSSYDHLQQQHNHLNQRVENIERNGQG